MRLLTVHGAKGLEARCVLLLDTDTRPQKAETMGVLVDWPGEKTEPAGFVFLASESSPPPSAEAALAAEQQARQREELNMLYVAMTRAKHCLALSSVLPSVSAPGSWWNRLAPLLEEVPSPLPDVGVDAASAADADEVREPASAHGAVTLLELPVLPPELRTVALMDEEPTDPADPGAPPSTPASRLGEAMHQLLEQAGVAGVPLADLREHGWPAARVARLAQDFDITVAAARAAAHTAQRILAGEGAWAWDAAVVDTTINEAPLRYQGQSLRIDRLVHCHQPPERAGWWVLDYKSAAQPERQPALQAQLQRYRAAVRLQSPGKRVWAAFLTGDGRMVLVPEEADVTIAATAGGLQEGRGRTTLGHTLAPAPQANVPSPATVTVMTGAPAVASTAEASVPGGKSIKADGDAPGPMQGSLF